MVKDLYFIGILFLVSSFSLLYYFKLKKRNAIKKAEYAKSAYQLYVDWCSEKNETSISVKDFELSFNSKGFVAFEALMDKHQLANPTSYPIHGYSWEAFKTNQSRSERKRRDEHFAASVIAGYATQSTSLGTLLGGNLWAARLGKKLSNHKND